MPPPGSSLDPSPEPKPVRTPKCARCRNHGYTVQLKGHSGKCRFFCCLCWKCSLITERTKIMATQRRIKRLAKEEPADPPRHPGGHGDHAGAVGVQGGGQGDAPRPGSVIRRDPGRAALGGPPSPGAVLGDPRLQSSHGRGGSGGRGGGLGVEGHQLRGSPWGSLLGRDLQDSACQVLGRHPPHFPKDYVIAEVSQREMYPGEVLSVPFPVKLYSRFPGGCSCQTILVNVPPGPAPFEEPPVPAGFPPLQPGSVPYCPESTQDGRVPFFPAQSARPGASPDRLQPLGQYPYPAPVLPREREQAAAPQGSPDSDVISVGTETSSQENV